MKFNFKSCLQTIGVILIVWFVVFFVLPDIFSPSEPDDVPSIISTTTTIPTYQNTSVSTTTPPSVKLTKTTSVLTSSSSAIPNISVLSAKDNPQSTELIEREYKWDYAGSEWTWNMQIPQALYDYYKGLPRSPTGNYSIYVTHPLDDSIFDKLVVSIKNNAQKEGFTEFQTLSFAIAFVQNLPYTSDLVTTGYDNYPRYPIETLVDNGGDCEDTAILAASLIRSLGYGTVLIVFPGTVESPGHCAVGVKGGEGLYGTYWELKGDKYYYIETTATGWKIGQIPDKYKEASAKLYPMIPVPVLTHDWVTKADGTNVELKVTINNLGSAVAKDVYVYAGFDAGNGKCWNHKESDLFDVDVNGSVVATLYLTPPSGVHTRWLVQIVYGGYAVDQSYSKWFDTY
jgi:hypothetical protein